MAPLVVSGSMDGTLRVWDLELEQPVAFSFHRRGEFLIGIIDIGDRD